MTLAYAASGQMPFGTGLSEAILYRILHGEPDIDAVPYLLRPLVEAALVKDPQRRPAAHELLARLTNPSARSEPGPDRDTGAVLARTWPGTEPGPVQQVLAGESLLLEPAPPGPARRRAARDLVRRAPGRGRGVGRRGRGCRRLGPRDGNGPPAQPRPAHREPAA